MSPSQAIHDPDYPANLAGAQDRQCSVPTPARTACTAVDTDARGVGGRKKLGIDVQAQHDNTALHISRRRAATCNRANE